MLEKLDKLLYFDLSLYPPIIFQLPLAVVCPASRPESSIANNDPFFYRGGQLKRTLRLKCLAVFPQ